MASDEGVLGRSLGINFARDGGGGLPEANAEKLYTIHRFERGPTAMHMIFRDHSISDLVGFVYSGMPAAEAAGHLLSSLKATAQPILNRGQDAVIPVILDGENAWEYYYHSGREFLRRFYDALQKEPGVEAVTVSEAIARHKNFNRFTSLVPGSWINANFNVWIGAPEDNKSWDYLYHARNFYTENAARAAEAQRKLAFEEILIAEGSDWNWWYGPEHHSANDRDFDELYRKHLSNVYQALGGTPPDYLAQPITGVTSRPEFMPQTSYIHPGISGNMVRYFEWMGAAVYTADRRAGAMHGKSFLLDSAYAGIDEHYVYGRLDFAGKPPETDFELVVNVESWLGDEPNPQRALRINLQIEAGNMRSWQVSVAKPAQFLATSEKPTQEAKIAFARNFEFRLPLSWLDAPLAPVGRDGISTTPAATKLRLRFSLWQNHLPTDALPLEGWIELQLLGEQDLMALA